MAITETVLLPAQPAAGNVRAVPLGGDGMVSPFQVTEVRVDQTGDASGGNIICNVVMDPAYISVVASMQHGVVNPGAAFTSRMDVIPRPFAGINFVYGATPDGAAVDFFNLSPTPYLLERIAPNDNAPRIAFNKANVNGESVTCTAIIYQFILEARVKVPIDRILGSVPFGFAQVPAQTF